MERDIQQRAFNGREFRTQKYQPDHSIRILTEIGAIVGGPIGQGVGAFAQGEDLGERTLGQLIEGVDGNLLGAAIANLFQSLHKVDAPNLLKRILRDTEISVENNAGSKVWLDVDLNRDFRADLFSAFEVAKWVLEVNYQNFSERLRMFAVREGGAKPAAMASLKQESES